MSNSDDRLIRLYLDEDVHGGVSKALRRQGYDVLSVNEAGKGGRSDWEQLAFAVEQNRAIFTFNAADFIALQVQYWEQELTHSGIIISKQITLEETIRRLLYLLAHVSAEEINNQLRWLPSIGSK